MEQRCRFEQQIQFVQPAGSGLILACDVLDPRQKHRDGFVTGKFRRAVDNFVRIFEPKRDVVTVLQLAAFRFFAVYKKATALPAVLNVKFVRFADDCGAVARNAPVVQLKMISGFRTTPDQEGRLRYAYVAFRAVIRKYFEDRLGNR